MRSLPLEGVTFYLKQLTSTIHDISLSEDFVTADEADVLKDRCYVTMTVCAMGTGLIGSYTG